MKRNAKISMIVSVFLLVSIPAAFINTYISFAIFLIVLVLHIGKEFFY